MSFNIQDFELINEPLYLIMRYDEWEMYEPNYNGFERTFLKISNQDCYNYFTKTGNWKELHKLDLGEELFRDLENNIYIKINSDELNDELKYDNENLYNIIHHLYR